MSNEKERAQLNPLISNQQAIQALLVLTTILLWGKSTAVGQCSYQSRSQTPHLSCQKNCNRRRISASHCSATSHCSAGMLVKLCGNVAVYVNVHCGVHVLEFPTFLCCACCNAYFPDPPSFPIPTRHVCKVWE